MNVTQTQKYSDEEISAILNTSPRHIHNTAKRGFNKLLASLLKTNTHLSLLDILTVIMDEFDLDGEEIKSMLNNTHEARLQVELIDEFKLIAWGKVTDEDYEKQKVRAKITID